MPTGELPPPTPDRFNQGIGLLPQIDPSDFGNPLNSSAGYPSGPEPVSFGNTPTGDSVQPPQRVSLSPAPGTPQDWRGNASGSYSPDWRENATKVNNPPSSMFTKITNLIGGIGSLFNGDGPNSTPPSDTPPGMPLTPQQQAMQHAANTGRVTNTAFAPSLHQLMFPGSAIGPGGSSVMNPYDPTAHRGDMSHDTAMSGTAAAFHNYVTTRNIA